MYEQFIIVFDLQNFIDTLNIISVLFNRKPTFLYTVGCCKYLLKNVFMEFVLTPQALSKTFVEYNTNCI